MSEKQKQAEATEASRDSGSAAANSHNNYHDAAPPPYSENEFQRPPEPLPQQNNQSPQVHTQQGYNQDYNQQGYQQYNNQNYQQQGSFSPDSKQDYSQGYSSESWSQQGYGNGGYSAVPQNYPPQQGFGSSGPPPNTYYVKPSIVDITRANPEHLNPAYQQYLKRDEERISQGNYPQGRENFKHGAPLEPGKTNPNSKTGGKRFPGRSGATYNDAANR
ncbi:hypothetical protein G9P44_000235 [Scheffersomyces stipitis]|nr:hypothetical protein G9P44_000235 [Scheffersomyces stipitis]